MLQFGHVSSYICVGDGGAVRREEWVAASGSVRHRRVTADRSAEEVVADADPHPLAVEVAAPLGELRVLVVVVPVAGDRRAIAAL